MWYAFIEKNLHISGPSQLKSVLFKGQLYIKIWESPCYPRFPWKTNIFQRVKKNFYLDFKEIISDINFFQYSQSSPSGKYSEINPSLLRFSLCSLKHFLFLAMMRNKPEMLPVHSLDNSYEMKILCDLLIIKISTDGKLYIIIF